MNILQVVTKINYLCDELEFSHARKFIENNLDKLKERRICDKLNSNAKALLKHVTQDLETLNKKGLTRLDMLKINEINKYCTDFDISMLKRTLKDNLGLLYREEVYNYLTNNAKYILETMGVQLTGNREIKEVVTNKQQVTATISTNLLE